MPSAPKAFRRKSELASPWLEFPDDPRRGAELNPRRHKVRSILYCGPQGGVGVQPLFNDIDEMALRERLAADGCTIIAEHELDSGPIWQIFDRLHRHPTRVNVVAEA